MVLALLILVVAATLLCCWLAVSSISCMLCHVIHFTAILCLEKVALQFAFFFFLSCSSQILCPLGKDNCCFLTLILFFFVRVSYVLDCTSATWSLCFI
uniref:Secreted peptide n=1 Tax=Populus trichocarpa TaxID=3694 RepID=A0A3N7FEB1_POPTR